MSSQSPLFHNLPYQGQNQSRAQIQVQLTGKAPEGREFLKNKMQVQQTNNYASTSHDESSFNLNSPPQNGAQVQQSQNNEPIFSVPNYQDKHAPFDSYSNIAHKQHRPSIQDNSNNDLINMSGKINQSDKIYSSAPTYKTAPSYPIAPFQTIPVLAIDQTQNSIQQKPWLMNGTQKNQVGFLTPPQFQTKVNEPLPQRQNSSQSIKLTRQPTFANPNLQYKTDDNIQNKPQNIMVDEQYTQKNNAQNYKERGQKIFNSDPSKSINQELTMQKSQQLEQEFQSLKFEHSEQLRVINENQSELMFQLEFGRQQQITQQEEFQMKFEQLAQQVQSQIEVALSEKKGYEVSVGSPRSSGFNQFVSQSVNPPNNSKLTYVPQRMQNESIVEGSQEQSNQFERPNKITAQKGPWVKFASKEPLNQLEVDKRFKQKNFSQPPIFSMQKQQNSVAQQNSVVQSIYKQERPSNIPSYQRSSIFQKKQLIQSHIQELKEPLNDRKTFLQSVNFQRLSAQNVSDETQFIKYLAATYPISRVSVLNNPNKSHHMVSQDDRDLLLQEYTFCMLCNQFVLLDKAESHSKKCVALDTKGKFRTVDLDIMKMFSCTNPPPQIDYRLLQSNEVQIVGLNEELQKIKYLTNLELRKQKDVSLIQRQVRELGQHSQIIMQFTIENNKNSARGKSLLQDLKQLFQIMDNKDIPSFKQFMFILQKGCVLSDQKFELMRLFPV